MTTTTDLAAITGPSAWRGDELASRTDWIYQLSDAERTELEQVGRQFLADDPDLRTVVAADYPLTVCAPAVAEWAADMDSGRGFVLVRGLRVQDAQTRCRARCTSSWACTWACRCVRTSSVT